MIKELKYIAKFIVSIIGQWINLLYFLPNLYSMAYVYLPEPINSFQLPEKLKNYFILIIVLISIYKAWRKEHLNTIYYKEKKTNFSIKPEMYKIKIENYLKKIDKKIINLKKRLPNVVLENIMNITTFNPFSNKPETRKSIQEEIEFLEKKKKEVKSFYNKNKSLIGINIYLESDKYDEKISIELNSKSDDLIQSFECPTLKIDSYENNNIMNLISIKKIDNNEVYRTNIDKNKKTISCDLKYIKKGESISFINEGIYIKTTNPKFEFEINITSKNSDGQQNFKFNLNTENITTYKEIDSIDDFNF